MKSCFVQPYGHRAIKLISICLCLSVGASGQGEYEGKPCAGSATIRLLLKKQVLKAQYIHLNEILCTSLLKPGGAVPNNSRSADYKKPDDYEKEMLDKETYDLWTCQYGTANLIDGNINTAWVEGAADVGKGELILITGQVDPSKKVEIWTGFGKSETLFKANHRPKTVAVHIIRATRQAGGGSQNGEYYENVTWIASGQATLQDANGFQPLPLPAFKKETYKRDDEDWDYDYWWMIEIIDVYPGAKYQDTCISEIRNVK